MSQLETHLLELEFDLNSWYDLQQQEWLQVLDTICLKNLDNSSQEVTPQLEAEVRWEAKQDYYSLRYYQSDRFAWS